MFFRLHSAGFETSSTRKRVCCPIYSFALRACIGYVVAFGFGSFNKIGWAQAIDVPLSRVVQFSALDIRLLPPVITAIAVSPNQQWMAAAGDDHAIRLVDLPSGKTVKTLLGHTDWVQSIDFSSDGESFVSCGKDRELWLWQADQNWSGHTLCRAEVALSVARFNPRENEIAFAGFGPKIHVWSLKQNRITKTYQSSCDDQRSIAFSSDGRKLAVGGRDGYLRIWEGNSNQPALEIKLHSDRIRSVSFSEDDTSVTTIGEDRRLVQLDLVTAQRKIDRQFKSGKLMAMSPVNSHMVAIAGSDNSIRLFCTRDVEEKSKLDGHLGSVAVLRCAGNQLISGSFDATIRIWNIEECLKRLPPSAQSNSVAEIQGSPLAFPTSVR